MPFVPKRSLGTRGSNEEVTIEAGVSQAMFRSQAEACGREGRDALRRVVRAMQGKINDLHDTFWKVGNAVRRVSEKIRHPLVLLRYVPKKLLHVPEDYQDVPENVWHVPKHASNLPDDVLQI